jgi:SagB-type dehydrogenase family enzyme
MTGRKTTLICAAILVFSSVALGLQDLHLPPPSMNNPTTLMEALSLRRTSREFAADPIPLQTVSDLLWAAFGVNRPDSGKRTAPSAMNMQEIDIYVAAERGLFLYDPGEHMLRMVVGADLRAATGMQPFVASAPLNLVLVADYSRMDPRNRGMTDETKLFYAACDAGYISQNIYLFCAANGLATVARGAVDRDALALAMELEPHQHVILAQTVGWPASP